MISDPLFLADVARRTVVLGTLFLSGWSDYRTREVSDFYWIAGAGIAGPLLAYLYLHGYYDVRLHLSSMLVAVALSAAARSLRIAGGADILAFIFIGVFEPPACYHPLTLFPLATTVIFAGAAALALSFHNALSNLEHGALSALEGYPVLWKAVVLLTMHYVTREEFSAKSYMFIPSTDERGRPQLTLSAKPSDPPPGLERFWASVLLPYVSLLAFGFSVYYILVFLLCPY